VFLNGTEVCGSKMDYTRFTLLAGELRVAILKERMGVATLEEVMAMSGFCTEWRYEVGKMLPGWLSKHSAGSRVGEFKGTEEQMRFVRAHIQGRQQCAYRSYRVER
jgi:hypothetical protein